ncbi:MULTISPECIES: anaerobic ribonucleoside-triphosphate reductase [Peptoniphilus]|uniref:anaerobic ribonucleoside-triphosphate reductase n=1 Tax=Peptoniphilus TaxID=162289 RepID=UPI0008DAE32F|nr:MULTISPECIES: anaerobic ribonucleoside-triphosphate reductase [Peptoniphilus]MBS6610399.1 anaerobic ribonucleoside-triphosphate reductase [Peptoniphilus harei]MDU1043571.1 anaerobic ribonucleoside-triphosphate reductase [Peptoniphilus rhinitidis]MDU1954600.1 anaerobic ribonucleoside-triphosphate reductase [Peptoniphilus lacydonensis]MDU2110057.1 anaerobic ribonucleoside-triphosphate reductase [Peptoniphilus lacydonensis]MDU5275884.1 anaerobic ribonucleoside-triphosphate reductase [Peptoniph
MSQVIKRNGKKVDFDRDKIVIAIEKAMHSSSGLYIENQALEIASEIEKLAKERELPLSIYDIESEVYYRLIQNNNPATARAYESYKSVQQYKREQNTTDEDILGLLNETNEDLMDENSNKNAIIASTQRDLIAGEVSKDIAKRKMIPADLVEAHESGAIHIHDMDYFIQPIFNCCLVNMKDMLDNGTVVNGKMIETPKSFQVACNVMTQIIAQIASNQYGGQSINISCLGKYLRRSYEKNLSLALDTLGDIELAEKMANRMTKKDLESGIQTIQYQINTLMTSNGQAPFVTLFMWLEDDDQYVDEVAMIIEEILKQRIQGIKNDAGVYVTPAFPKLIYVLDENNINKDSKYYYLTSLAVRCTAKRMYPDYISAKKMRANYEGNVFSPMGCRAFLPPYKDEKGNYKFEGRFNMGACSINLPQIGILAGGDEEKFFEILEKRLDLVKRVGLLRYEHLKKVTSDSSPIHWQHGAIARLGKHESIAPLLLNGYSTVSLGYIGIYEATVLTKGVSHTTKKGYDFAMRIMDALNDAVKKWTKEYGIKFTLYATPAESLTQRFCNIDKKRFGIIENVTDKGYYINSFHVDVREEISAFEKFTFESKFQDKSTGGCISYVEIPNMGHNLEALETIVRFIYDNIQYAEFNTKSDYCSECGFDGEIKLNEEGDWECPQCHNKDRSTLSVVRRTCGYLGENFWNEGRTKEINARVLHI